MTDMELLEMAAKAAGLPVEFQDEFGDSGVNGWYPCGRDEGGDVLSWWNPLKDDGDALRLAIRLGFKVEPGRCWHSPYGPAFGEDVLDGELKSTRRAITRAAAEIGRQMP